jgi:predicted aspartyl protease
MGIFRTTIGVESPGLRDKIHYLPDTMVDTGSEFSWVPRPVLDSLGVTPERSQGFLVADGRRIDREIGYAIIHAGGTATSDDVVFAEDGDMILLGARSLEGLNLKIDVVRKQLVDAGPIVAAHAA